MRSVLYSIAAVALVAPAAFAQEGQRNASSSGGQCITQQARTNIAECPEGARQMTKRARQADAPLSRLRTAERQQDETKQQQRGPSIEIDAATARGRERVQARAAQLLEREIRILKRLVQNTRSNNPQRPDILLRLAETFFEMQTALTARVRSFDEPIYQSCNVRKNRNQCREARQGQQRAQEQLNETRQESITTYATLVRDHPDYGRMDEVLFSLAFGLEELRQHDRARQVYHRLIKGYPQSRFIPHAYLSFAEFFFGEGEMTASLRFYDKVVEFPPERNPVYGYALYKSAWAHYNNENFQQSLRAFVETIEFATQNPEATDAQNLARQSRRELVMPYAMVGNPGQALEFFRRYATNEEQALEMLESLAELYYDTGQWPETIQVYHELMSEASDGDKLCYWQSRVTNAVISSAPKDAQVREMTRMVDIYETFIGRGSHPADTVTECKSETAGILAWVATAWHREAIGTPEQPGTNDRGTMQNSARLYRLLIDKFPDMEELEFTNIARDDWPTVYKVSYYYAELLWKMEEWAQCGPAFDRVVELNPQGEYTSDAAYAAVLCYNNLYQQQYQSRERQTRAERSERRGRRGRRGRRQQEEPETPSMQPREFTDLEEGMLNAFGRYVCYVNDSDDLDQIKYRRARIYYEANHFEEAAQLFRDIAWNHRESELAEYAANLYLDSLNVMGSQLEPNRPECLQQIETDIDPLNGFYCSTQSDADLHPDLCGVLTTLKCNVMRKTAEAFGNNQQHKRAAAQYVRIFRRHQECAEEDGFAMDEVLYNAAIHFEAARLLGRAIQVRNVLIERFPESEYSKRAIYLVGANFHALAFYEQAAGYYERFARQFPGEDGSDCSEEDRENGTCAIASEALQNAVFFRMGLGNTEQAEEDATLFARNYRRRLPRETSQVMFGLGSIYERAEDWGRVQRHYGRFLRDYRRTALPNQLLRANVLVGRSHWEEEDTRGARRYFQNAVDMWARVPEQISALEDVSDAEKIKYLTESVDNVAEALFYLAEYKYEEFKAVRFPRYNGGRSLERINRWAQGDFAEWVQEKMAALQAAEAEYNKIAELRVNVTNGVEYQSAPWQIAAAARSGEMYQLFVSAFRSAPIPEEIENDHELFDIYVGALDEQSEPLQQQAIQRFEFCLRTATNVRWFNEWSRVCEEQLNELNPREYPMAAELRGEPNYIRGSIGQPGPVDLPTDDDAESVPETGAGGSADAAAGGE